MKSSGRADRKVSSAYPSTGGRETGNLISFLRVDLVEEAQKDKQIANANCLEIYKGLRRSTLADFRIVGKGSSLGAVEATIPTIIVHPLRSW